MDANIEWFYLAAKKLYKNNLIPFTRSLWHGLRLCFFWVQYCKGSNSSQRCIFPHQYQNPIELVRSWLREVKKP